MKWPQYVKGYRRHPLAAPSRKEHDPVESYRNHLIIGGIHTEKELDEMNKELSAEVKETVAWALASPDPPVEEAYTDLYAE